MVQNDNKIHIFIGKCLIFFGEEASTAKYMHLSVQQT